MAGQVITPPAAAWPRPSTPAKLLHALVVQKHGSYKDGLFQPIDLGLQPQMTSDSTLAEGLSYAGCKQECHPASDADEITQMRYEHRGQNTNALTPGGFGGLDCTHPNALLHPYNCLKIHVLRTQADEFADPHPVSAANQKSVSMLR